VRSLARWTADDGVVLLDGERVVTFTFRDADLCNEAAREYAAQKNAEENR
jgi:hypothetical protein